MSFGTPIANGGESSLTQRRKQDKQTPNDSRNHTDKLERRSDPGVKLSDAGFALVDYSSILAMVFGGCCANVWTYEQLLMLNPRIGSALTFSQMVFITVQSIPLFLILPRNTQGKATSWIPRLKPRQVPLAEWILQVFVLTSGTLLNNWAFAFNVPLAVMIVFRSAEDTLAYEALLLSGLAVSMLLGYFVLKRRYNVYQVVSVLIVSVGVVLATLSKSSSASTKTSAHDNLNDYAIGISMLVVSLLLTGVLGILQEKAYKKYGPCWQEGVFYTVSAFTYITFLANFELAKHFLALPAFLFLGADLKQGFASLSENKASSTASWLMLAANLATQLICVSGVNRLTSVAGVLRFNESDTHDKEGNQPVHKRMVVWWLES
ncbi:golgi uridine diphosphate-N-acetylglucosamine transporter [Paramarasmius palmivorus]|uniref:Golgi uridine diphosphate-N-acetylglucosamine transporter n=1 Tax=Paramarasmius palmivorus TaxID=297713 RepID=A0AAW0D0Y1_9AGAR